MPAKESREEPKDRSHVVPDKGLRIILCVAAAGCLVSFLGVVAPWSWLLAWMRWQYGVVAPSHPVFVYGVRVACATYGCAGVYFLLLAADARRHPAFLVLGAIGLVTAGAVCLAAGWSVGMRPRGYLLDVAYMWTTGALILKWRPRCRQ